MLHVWREADEASRGEDSRNYVTAQLLVLESLMAVEVGVELASPASGAVRVHPCRYLH